MLKVGITGGIASGKTTVTHLFEILRIPIYYADDRAKSLMINNPIIIHALTERFGKEVYINGNLNKELLRHELFNNSESKVYIDSVVHPVVYEDSNQWFSAQKKTPYAIKEAALLIESNGHLEMDKIIVVFTPIEIRIERLMKRDAISEEEALKRIASQMDETSKLKLADYVILNDGEHSLIEQVLAIHSELNK